MLYSVADPNLRIVPNGGFVGKIDATDVLFTAGDGVTKLNHQIESYNAATGQFVAWLQVPGLSPATDTVLYVYYGNAAAPDQQNILGVWDSSYKGVWHFAANGNFTPADSTASISGVINANVVGGNGQVGGGANFNGSANLAFSNSAAAHSSVFTYEAWVNPASSNDAYLLSFTNGGPALRLFNSQVELDKECYLGLAGAPQAIPLSSWTHLAVTYDTTGRAILYVNGVGSTPVANAQPLYFVNLSIGNAHCYSAPFSGLMDELRISTAARSADWIITGYRNQSAPSSFYSLGPNEIKP
jgi:biopolymer transport protein ExbB